MKIILRRFGIIVPICIIAMSMLLTSCKDDFSEQQQKVYHDDTLIAASKDRFSYRKFLSKKQSDEAVTITFQGFTGTKQVFEFDNQEETTITINYNLELEAGEFKAVIILPDDSVETICENTMAGSSEILLPVGKTKIKIVGLSAQEGKLELSYEGKLD